MYTYVSCTDLYGVCSFWGRRQSAFFDIRVFHPNAPSYRHTEIASLFRKHELEKKRGYGDRVRAVESASFTPLTFSTLEDLGRETPIFYSRLADLLPNIHLSCYSHTVRVVHLADIKFGDLGANTSWLTFSLAN